MPENSPTEFFEHSLPWRCPICRAKHTEPAEHCRRCGCRLGLLKKFDALAQYKESRGLLKQARALGLKREAYRSKKMETGPFIISSSD